MTKIQSLTEEQKLLLPKFRKEWHDVGICTDRADRVKAQLAICAMRKEVGVTNPPIFIWCDSPAISLMALQFIKSTHWKKFLAEVERNLRKNGLPKVDVLSHRDELGASLRASLGDSLGDSNSKLTEELGKEWWGQHEAYWIAFYLFARDIVGVKYDDKRSRQLDMWRDVAQSCCWWWAYENYVIVSERPTTVAMDERGRIHSHTGPAVAFADGWKVYASHGVRLPEYIIERPSEITVKKIEKEANVEIRRVMVEQYGAAKFLTDSGAKKIHEDDYGVLYRKEMPGDEPMVFVDVVNSTAEPDGSFRKYMLRVPPDTKTARAAVAWTFGKTEAEYEPAMET